jgi:hypothetical protein
LVPERKKSRIEKRAESIAMVTIFGLMIGAVAMSHHFANVCPWHADVASGHIYPFREDGGSVYLTVTQNRFSKAMEWLYIFALIFGTILMMLARWFGRSESEGDRPEN